MKTALCAACLLCIAAGVALADADFEFGPIGPPWAGEEREGICQHGFWDDGIGWGWTLGRGQQLGIECPAAVVIFRVGFYVEFILAAGALDIVTYDDGLEVSRTNLPAGSVAPGVNAFFVEPVEIFGEACVVLCAVDNTNGYWSVLGEDYTTAPNLLSFYSNSCNCDFSFTESSLAMWVEGDEITPVVESSWGNIRTMFR